MTDSDLELRKWAMEAALEAPDGQYRGFREVAEEIYNFVVLGVRETPKITRRFRGQDFTVVADYDEEGRWVGMTQYGKWQVFQEDQS